MNEVTILSLGGAPKRLPGAAFEAMARELAGELVTAASDDYDAVRTVWNGMVDRRPAVIARCHGSGDVVRCVRFAREHDLRICVRGGGHHIAGNSVADDTFMIDLSLMTSVDVNPSSARATVGPGATLADVDEATQAFGLALPMGINSTTGIAGLTLGGGFGWLTRKYGLTVDSLIGADLVTTEGKLVRVSGDENAELFWAIRGGGGNFGIVTSFEFALHSVGPEVVAGLIVYPLTDARDVLRGWRDALAVVPEELSVWTVMRHAPPLPFLAESVHGTKVVVLALVHHGTDADADIEPFRRLGTPVGEHLGPMPFADFQKAFDPLLEPGARNYWKSHDFASISDGLIDALIAAANELPSPECEVFVAQLGGAMQRVGVEETAYPGREAGFVMNVHGRWRDPADDPACIGWARRLFDAATPHALGTAYVNFMTADETTRLRTAYGRNFERLLQIKRSVDPDNFFRINQNIASNDAASGAT